LTLYADIGNSRVKLIAEEEVFGNETSFSYEIASLSETLAPALKDFPDPKRVIVSNVAGQIVAEKFQQACLDAWTISPEFLTVESECCGISIGYKDPSQLGIDRWLGMIAAWNLYKTDICVVDCGTAITVDIVTHEGKHLGGYIIPGFDIMNDALRSKTILKNTVVTADSTLAPGTTTQDCMANGAMLAIKSFLEAIINRLNKQHGYTFSCIITGGASELIGNQLNIETHYERNLLFTGMKLVAGN
jgi:type III pantothenate kinase